jgi:hypothetical protein
VQLITRKTHLIHASVGKEQSGIIVRYGARRVDIFVFLLLNEEVYERLSYVLCRRLLVHFLKRISEH